ncbi:MAG: hypothetical protein AB1349_08610 [Elusimicrobiota bacterium]
MKKLLGISSWVLWLLMCGIVFVGCAGMMQQVKMKKEAEARIDALYKSPVVITDQNKFNKIKKITILGSKCQIPGYDKIGSVCDKLKEKIETKKRFEVVTIEETTIDCPLKMSTRRAVFEGPWGEWETDGWPNKDDYITDPAIGTKIAEFGKKANSDAVLVVWVPAFTTTTTGKPTAFRGYQQCWGWYLFYAELILTEDGTKVWHGLASVSIQQPKGAFQTVSGLAKKATVDLGDTKSPYAYFPPLLPGKHEEEEHETKAIDVGVDKLLMFLIH